MFKKWNGNSIHLFTVHCDTKIGISVLGVFALGLTLNDNADLAVLNEV